MFGFGRRPIQKLDFIVAGAQKSGTTALNYYLKRHPQIALPVKKEVHFFDNDELFAGGNVSYEPLHEMFRPARLVQFIERLTDSDDAWRHGKGPKGKWSWERP